MPLGSLPLRYLHLGFLNINVIYLDIFSFQNTVLSSTHNGKRHLVPSVSQGHLSEWKRGSQTETDIIHSIVQLKDKMRVCP